MFKEYLLSAMKSQTPVSIYTDNEDVEKFSLGFIQGVSDDFVLLASISPFGFYDGFTLKNYIAVCAGRKRQRNRSLVNRSQMLRAGITYGKEYSR